MRKHYEPLKMQIIVCNDTDVLSESGADFNIGDLL